MKKYLNGILVVEGKEDASYLSNYIASEIVTVGGYDIKQSLISYLKDKRVIVLTDPDEAGNTIRNTLNQKLDNPINIIVDMNKCTRGNKNGIAECQIDEIMHHLSPYFVDKEAEKEGLNISDLNNLGILENKELRAYVCKELNLGECNNKKLLKRLNLNHVQLEEINKIVKKYQNGN